MRSHFI